MIKCVFVMCFVLSAVFSQQAFGQLAKWKNTSVKSVLDEKETRHSIHSYFNTCPESPDGKYVLYFSSKTKDAHVGDICLLNRQTKEELVLVEGVVTEDAHRAACQQWAGNGEYVVYHDYKSGIWQVIAVNIKTKVKRVLAQNRQLGFGTPSSMEVPLYGCHWNPKEYRHLEMVNVETKKVSKVVDIKEVLETYGDWIKSTFKTDQVSIFFPVVSPDGNKVFFKIARGSGTDDFRSKKASFRRGKVVYDLQNRKFIKLFEHWGHPAWSPDSTEIIEKGNFTENIFTGKRRNFSVAKKGALKAPSDHPSMSPSGQFFVTDANISKRQYGSPGMWAIVLGECSAESDYLLVHKFMNNKGARSWRVSHPHPIFNAKGNRIYFNVSSDDYTRLFVAELRE